MSMNMASLLGKELAAININSPIDVIRLSQDGLSKEILIQLGRILSLGQKDLADLVSVSLRTLQRYRKDTKLNPVVSENMIQIIEVIKLGYEVFENKDAFLEWLNNPNKALAQMKPINLLKFRAGSELVRNLIGQIQHGIVS